MKHIFTLAFSLCTLLASGQAFMQPSPAAQRWVDSTFSKLYKKEKIAQLMVLRMSERRGKEVVFFEKEVAANSRKYNVGSI